MAICCRGSLRLCWPMEDVSYPVFSPRKPAASTPTEQLDDERAPAVAATSDAIPFALPVTSAAHHGSSPLRTRFARATSVEFGGNADGHLLLLRTTLKLVVFHWLNSMLGVVAFAIVAGGTLASLLLLPLCCFGFFVFRAVVYLVGVLAEMDVGLYNFISPPESQVFVNVPRHAAAYGLDGERLSPELYRLTSRTLLAAVYFATIKFGVGLLSSITLSIAFSLPVGAISRGNLGDNFHGFFGFLVFMIATTLLLAIGIPLMFYAARLSRSATRHFCCEKFSTYHLVNTHDPVAAPAAAAAAPASYGSTDAFVSV